MVSIGIDLGTTSIKVCIVREGESLVEKTVRHGADIPGKLGQQCALKILEAAVKVLKETVTDFRNQHGTESISRLRIAGQMHGLVLWNEDRLLKGTLDCSPLYTWMYRNLEDHTLPVSTRPVYPGFGALTLLQLKDYGSWNCCGTIMDLFACQLCGLREVKMSWQLAESWGYCSDGRWDSSLEQGVKNKTILPEIINDDQYCLGQVKGLDFLEGIDVLIPLGDLQASIKSVADESLDAAYLILGTSSQLCIIASQSVTVSHPTVDRLPYSLDRVILAGRSMNGGNAIDAFLKMVVDWMRELTGTEPRVPDIERLLAKVDDQAGQERNRGLVSVIPTFIQERGLPLTRVTVSGLDYDTSIVQVVQAICNGVVNNFASLFPLEILSSLGIKKLHMVGNAKKPRFSRRIQELCQTVGIKAIPAKNDTSAAYGVAIF